MKKLILLMFIATLLPAAAIGQKKTADWEIHCAEKDGGLGNTLRLL